VPFLLRISIIELMDMSTIKERLNQPFPKIILLLILVSMLSFGIGYLSAKNWTPAPIIIEKNSS